MSGQSINLIQPAGRPSLHFLSLRFAAIVLVTTASLSHVPSATACTIGADNNCTSVAEPDATSTQVRNRPNTTVGNPISLITGNKYQRETDYQLAGSRLSFHRHYNSRNTDFNFGYGRGWTSTFGATLKRVIEPGSDNISGYQIIQGDGRLLQFHHREVNHEGIEILRGERNSDGYVIEQGERYLWVMPDGRQLSFHGSYLIKINYPGYEFLTLHYRHRRVVSVTDQANRVLRFEYTEGHGGLTHYEQSSFQESPGHLSRLILPDGKAIEYDYDSELNLSRIRYPDGTARIFHYEDAAYPNHLTGITNRAGNRYSSWTYDAEGRAISSEHGDGVERVTLEYDTPDDELDIGTTTVTNSVGEISRYTWQALLSQNETILLTSDGPGCVTCPPAGMSYAYNEQFDLVSAMDKNGDRKEYAYDDVRRLIEISQHLANGTKRTIAHYAYAGDSARPISIAQPSVNPDGDHIILLEHNADGLTTSITELGYAPTDTTSSVFTPIERTTRLTYQDGRLISVDGPRDDVDDITRYTYDPLNRLQSVTPPSGITTTLSDFDEHGRATVFRTGSASPLSITYDQRGNVVRVAKQGREIRYHYNTDNNLISLTTPNGKTSNLEYDAAGRLTQVTDDLGQVTDLLLDSESRVQTKTDYGMNGDIIRSLQLVYDASGRLQSQTTEERNPSTGELTDHTANFEYDAYDRPHTILNSSNSVNQFLSYGSFGHLTRFADPYGVQVQAHYDHKGQDIGRTDARLNTTHYLKDDFGHIVLHQSPDTGLVRYEYDASGNRTKKIAADNSETTYRWDSASRLIKQINTDGVTAYTYAASNGLLETVSYPTGSDDFAYDANGQLTLHTRTIDGKSFATAYAYDTSGKLEQKTLPDGQILRYHYHEAGINKGTIRAITRTALFGLRQETLVAEIDIDPRDGSSGYLSHNGIRTERRYSPDGKVTEVRIDPALKLEYRYDDYGRIVGINENSIDLTFGYDRNKLTSASSANQDFRYTYDAVGNRLTASESHGSSVESNDYQYPLPGDGNRLLLSTDHSSGLSAEYVYNDAGSPIATARGLRYEYNAEQRPVRVYADGSLLAEYSYNSFGERIRKVRYDNGQKRVTYYLYDGHTLTAEIDGDTGQMRQSIFLNHQAVVRLEGNTPYAVHGDHLGTPRLITNDDQTTVWQAEYSPTGEATLQIADITFNHRRPGQFEDPETGTLYNYLRDYDPKTGRYLTSDPIGLQGGLNTYAYANNDLLGSADVLGLSVVHGDTLMGLQNAVPGPLNPVGLQSSTGFGVPNPSDISTPNPAANDAVDNDQLIQQYNVVQFDDCSGVVGEAINLGDNGTTVLWTYNLSNINYHVSHDPEGVLGYEININTYDGGFNHSTVDLTGEQVNELQEGISQLPPSGDEQFLIAIAEGTTCEQIEDTVRRTVGNLVTEDDLSAIYASLPLNSNCVMTGAALLDLTPLYEEILARFQTNLMTEPRVDQAYTAFVDANNALQAHIELYGPHPCGILVPLHEYDQRPCDERRRLEAELAESYQVFLDTTSTVYEEMLSLGHLPPYAANQAAGEEATEQLIGLIQTSVILVATEFILGPIAASAVLSTRLGRLIHTRITSTGVALSSMSARVMATAAARIDRIRMLRYRDYPSIRNLDFATARRLETQLGPDRLRRLDSDFSNHPELSDAIRNEPELLNSWQLLDDLGASAGQRSNIDFVRDTQTYSQHNIPMVRNADGVIEPELPSVTYQRPADRPDLDTHIVNIDVNPETGNYRIVNGGLGGGHNRDNFIAALDNPRGLNPPVAANIINRVEIRDSSGRVVGERIQYRLPRLDNNGAPVFENGSPVYLAQPSTKSVYDPTVISDNEMIDLARSVGQEFYENNYAEMLRRGSDGSVSGTVVRDGLEYQVYLKTVDGRIVVDNVHLR